MGCNPYMPRGNPSQMHAAHSPFTPPSLSYGWAFCIASSLLLPLMLLSGVSVNVPLGFAVIVTDRPMPPPASAALFQLWQRDENTLKITKMACRFPIFSFFFIQTARVFFKVDWLSSPSGASSPAHLSLWVCSRRMDESNKGRERKRKKKKTAKTPKLRATSENGV
ncbi:hypothetical protein BD324DRAFT_634611 [Kockovaella imperatae]|uniref:Uncharacterized protein n=1 Tax=Kockovaella imperatae TaxID=4999 RepID=A0A1Y1U9K9_9TREE|nr:hypothetical protein BD324DRAFT_634611 [Kockovaella imperatae]ORX34718.1 hypothetical protein BD324DRAFT_634611 [Kockovaella imperatae]